jgi:hypothetical protein
MIEHDHVEPELEIQEEQVWEEYGGPQAPSCEETKIPFPWGRQGPVHPTTILDFFFFWINTL